MKVLFLTYDGLTDPLGQSQVLPYLAGLSGLGHTIFVLSLEKQTNYNKRRADIEAVCDQYSIHWSFLTFPEKKGIFTQVITLLRFRKLSLELAQKNNINLVHCRSYPAAIAGIYIRQQLSVPYVFDIRGFWIDERKEGKIWNFKNPLIVFAVALLRKTEKKLYTHALSVVVLTSKAEEIIRKKFLQELPGKQVTVIPCSVDFQIFKPIERNKQTEVRKLHEIPPEAFVLAYLGSLGTWYLLNEMLDFFKSLLHHQPHALFLFISAEDPEHILSSASQKEIPVSKILIRPASREQVPALIRTADCGIAFIRPDFSKQASSPVKWAEMLACGVPLVTNDIGDISILQARLAGVYLLKEFAASDYESIIKQLEKLTDKQKLTIATDSQQVFDLVKAIQAYQQVYSQANNRKILIIASHRPGRAPNQRFRFEQYFPFLRENGFTCELSYIIKKKEDDFIYEPGHLFKKAWLFYVSCWLRRMKLLKKLDDYDIIIVVREALMTRSLFFEKQFRKSRAVLVYDFDDSIWLSNVSAANRLFSRMKNPSKTSRIISMAHTVIAGNEYLAAYASRWNKAIINIPTTVDTADFAPGQKTMKDKGTIVIGWTGSVTTIPHFQFIEPVLLKLKMKYGKRLSFIVIGKDSYTNPSLDIEGIAWSLAKEKEELSRFDIGIMPLPDDEWTRGKCGFKGLMCMSMGIPVVMSPVGVNKDIIQDGENGFLAVTEAEWIEKLSLLIDSEDLRREMGMRGRETVVRKYSAGAWRQVYLELFRTLSTKDAEK